MLILSHETLVSTYNYFIIWDVGALEKLGNHELYSRVLPISRVGLLRRETA